MGSLSVATFGNPLAVGTQIGHGLMRNAELDNHAH
jgi:hypothetical protein